MRFFLHYCILHTAFWQCIFTGPSGVLSRLSQSPCSVAYTPHHTAFQVGNCLPAASRTASAPSLLQCRCAGQSGVLSTLSPCKLAYVSHHGAIQVCACCIDHAGLRTDVEHVNASCSYVAKWHALASWTELPCWRTALNLL